MIRALTFVALLIALPAAAGAQSTFGPADFAGLAVTQHLGQTLPLDAALYDDGAQPTTLGALLQAKPLLLVLGYFRCPNLCGLERRALVEAFDQMPLKPGRDFNLAVISVDPREGPAEAVEAKTADLALFAGHDGTGWHYLTGARPELERIATAAGFAFRYDAALDQYAHPIGLMMVTPEGVMARYIQGFGFTPRDIELALTDAGQGAIASPSERILLLCYHYDPATGRYTPLVGELLRGTAIATLAAFGLLIFLIVRRRPG